MHEYKINILRVIDGDTVDYMVSIHQKPEQEI